MTYGGQKINFAQLHKANVARQKKSFPTCKDWVLSDWGCSLAGEVGEVCNLLKKIRRQDPLALSLVAKELADVVCYSDLLANKLGIDLGEAVRWKFNEVSERVGSDVQL